MVIGLDPGPTASALVILDGATIEHHVKAENDVILALVSGHAPDTSLVIEQIAAMGMAVGAEVFETCFWSGRFAQAWIAHNEPAQRLKRGEIKMHLCGTMRAKDANVRQALIDRFGGSSAIGKKRQPGPLYGISGDCWSALAIACTYYDLQEAKR